MKSHKNKIRNREEESLKKFLKLKYKELLKIQKDQELAINHKKFCHCIGFNSIQTGWSVGLIRTYFLSQRSGQNIF